MTKTAPGKSYRKGISLMAAMDKFGTDAKAEAWLIECRWPDGMRCPYCESGAVAPRSAGRLTPQYYCRDCDKKFTVKTGTIMHNSRLPLRKWAVAFFLYNTSLKGVSSMKLHRDLDITQKTAWYLAHRIRETWNDETERVAEKFAGPVEADETYMGGREANKHADKKLHAGRGPVGKTAVAGIKDRPTNRVKAKVVAHADGPTLRGFVHQNTEPGATVYTDESLAYRGLRRHHESVKHSVGEFVRAQPSTNGMESFWATLKRAHDGVYHRMSAKHLHRYVTEFEGRHNVRPLDTADQMATMAAKSVGKHLPYADLIGPEQARLDGI